MDDQKALSTCTCFCGSRSLFTLERTFNQIKGIFMCWNFYDYKLKNIHFFLDQVSVLWFKYTPNEFVLEFNWCYMKQKNINWIRKNWITTSQLSQLAKIVVQILNVWIQPIFYHIFLNSRAEYKELWSCDNFIPGNERLSIHCIKFGYNWNG